MKKRSLKGLFFSVWLLAPAAMAAAEVEVSKTFLRANEQAFGVELKNNTIDGQDCTLDFALELVSMDSAPDSTPTIADYRVTLPIAYQDQKSYTQEVYTKGRQDIGRKAVPAGSKIKKVTLKKQACKVILPMATAQLARGGKGFNYIVQNSYSGRDYICKLKFTMTFAAEMVDAFTGDVRPIELRDEVGLLPIRVNKGDNFVENHPQGTAYFNSHAANKDFKNFRLAKVEVADVKCKVVPGQKKEASAAK